MPKHLQVCGSCQKQKPYFDKLVSVFKYTDDIKDIVLNFKYNDKLHLVKPFGQLISTRLKLQKLDTPDFIIPVPLHQKKLRQRMFNQSALLAKYISTKHNIDYVPNMLIRTKHNPSQTNYTKIMRAKNVHVAFAINHRYEQSIKNKKILLIDDVTTTGATINECCKILKRQQCKYVAVATLAKRVL